MTTLEVFVPTAATRVVRAPLAARHGDLHGRRIGWLDNMKANAGALLAEVSAQLHARGFEFEAVQAAKDATAAAPADVMAHLKTCDAVVLAIAD